MTACPKTKDATFDNPQQFRPIAITPIQSRILDKIALDYLDQDMKPREDVCQYAYKTRFSTTDALISTMDFILSSLDANTGSAVKAIFLEYSSAFNTVLQNQLIQIVHNANPNLAVWLHSYLQNWTQAVK